MSKAFTNEDAPQDDAALPDEPEVIPAGQKNYMTPTGFQTLQDELKVLVNDARPKIVEIVSWAAGNGDRSENGDYIYGKKRLREIDRRIRYLMKRLESATVVDPKDQQKLEQVFFGATVTYVREDDSEHTVTIVGVDEADMQQQKISWLSPLARGLMKARIGDEKRIQTPSGIETVEIRAIRYIVP